MHQEARKKYRIAAPQRDRSEGRLIDFAVGDAVTERIVDTGQQTAPMASGEDFERIVIDTDIE